MSETREYYEEQLTEAYDRIAELQKQLDMARAEERETAVVETNGCAWCAEELGVEPRERGSTGICERHRAEFLEEAFAERHSGKRLDQVLFSAAVLLGALAVGLVVGAWLAVWRFGAVGILK